MSWPMHSYRGVRRCKAPRYSPVQAMHIGGHNACGRATTTGLLLCLLQKQMWNWHGSGQTQLSWCRGKSKLLPEKGWCILLSLGSRGETETELSESLVCVCSVLGAVQLHASPSSRQITRYESSLERSVQDLIGSLVQTQQLNPCLLSPIPVPKPLDYSVSVTKIPVLI